MLKNKLNFASITHAVSWARLSRMTAARAISRIEIQRVKVFSFFACKGDE